MKSNKTKLNHKGFSHVEVIIVIVVVVAILGVGFFVYHHGSKKTASLSSSQTKLKSAINTPTPKTTSVSAAAASVTSSTSSKTTSTNTSPAKKSTTTETTPSQTPVPVKTETPFSTVISQFTSAMGSGNTNVVVSLQSPAFDSVNSNANNGDTSYYDYCQKQKALCVDMYEPSNLSGASVTSSSYTPNESNPPQGEEETFSINNSQLSAVFSVDVIPNGDSWLVDYVNVQSVSIK